MSFSDQLLEDMRNQNKIKALVTLKKDIMAGVKDLDSGRFRIYSDANLISLADEIGRSGRNRLIATRGTDPIPHCGTYNQDDATGFIHLNALRLKVAAKVQKKR